MKLKKKFLANLTLLIKRTHKLKQIIDFISYYFKILIKYFLTVVNYSLFLTIY